MSHTWYLQLAGKQYGPLTSAQLKKLAAEGKVVPSTQIRLGTDGKWTPAARVQGLFPQQPPVDELTSSLVLASSVVVPPPPPPVASPVAKVPVARVAPVASASVVRAAAPAPSQAGKLVGAVGLIFGILALATFWLPVLDSVMGWTGIIVGALGVLLGITGLVLAATQGGAGLYLNVATASSALVGFVLTVVLGIKTGMFTRPAPAPEPVAIAPRVIEPKPAPAPEPEPAIEPEPEPQPPPEPVWTDASQAIEQGPIRAKISSIQIEQVRLESMDLTQMRRTKPQPMLHLRVSIENLTSDKIVAVPGWNGPLAALPSGVGDLLKGSPLGDQVASASATASLTDQAGNFFEQTPAVRLSAAQADLSASASLRPGQTTEKDLLFAPPLDSSEYLRLELSAAGFSGSEPLRFQIPRALFTGK